MTRMAEMPIPGRSLRAGAYDRHEMVGRCVRNEFRRSGRAAYLRPRSCRSRDAGFGAIVRQPGSECPTQWVNQPRLAVDGQAAFRLADLRRGAAGRVSGREDLEEDRARDRADAAAEVGHVVDRRADRDRPRGRGAAGRPTAPVRACAAPCPGVTAGVRAPPRGAAPTGRWCSDAPHFVSEAARGPTRVAPTATTHHFVTGIGLSYGGDTCKVGRRGPHHRSGRPSPGSDCSPRVLESDSSGCPRALRDQCGRRSTS